MLWINYFSLQRLWSAPSRKKNFEPIPACAAGSGCCLMGTQIIFFFLCHWCPPASLARLELWLKITRLTFVPEKRQTHLHLSCCLRPFFPFSGIFKCLKCHSLVLFRWMDSPYWNHLTTPAPLPRMLSLLIHNFTELWRTSTSELLAA